MDHSLLNILLVLVVVSGVYSEVLAPGLANDVDGAYGQKILPKSDNGKLHAGKSRTTASDPYRKKDSGGTEGVYGIKTRLKPVIAISTPEHEHLQLGKPGKAVYGAYSFTSPEGYKFVFAYIADHLGFRVMGPGIPTDTNGASANGYQTLQQLNLI